MVVLCEVIDAIPGAQCQYPIAFASFCGCIETEVALFAVSGLFLSSPHGLREKSPTHGCGGRMTVA